MKIRKDDTVLVISGKDKGKRGKVHQVYPSANRLMVEGVNVVKRHLRPRGGVRQAGIIEKEAPLALSNVMLICNKCEHPTRTGFLFLEDGKKVRVCRSCREVID